LENQFVSLSIALVTPPYAQPITHYLPPTLTHALSPISRSISACGVTNYASGKSLWFRAPQAVAESNTMNDEKPRRSAWKILRWIVLIFLLLALGLLLKKPAPVAEPMTSLEVKKKADEFQSKLADLEASHNRGEPAEGRFTADEVNAAFQQGAAPDVTKPSQDPASTASPASGSEPLPEVKTVQVAFVDDHVTGQFATSLYGREVYLTISGKIGVSGGYATFEFTQAKIGDLPVAVSLLNSRLQEKLREPENHEKLKLPDFVADLRVENGQLIVVEK